MGLLTGAIRWYGIWVAGVAGYLLGSVLTADVVARIARGRASPGDAVDIRSVGSGNPGAANVMANMGTGWGIAVLAGDIGKGALAALTGRFLMGGPGAFAAGIGAVAGHCFPAWADFRGGKGIATSAGTTWVLFPLYVPIDMALILVSYLRIRHATAATFITSGAFVLAALAWWRLRLPNAWAPSPGPGLPLYAAATTAMIVYRFLAAPPHRGDRPR
ncbi:MAG: glycerol-3-phosphate acyltransferase [Dehalococcoidia bacterium]|nr:glycerol-3-phosphate acyltransferase [Dehalococcoidia bacterium]